MGEQTTKAQVKEKKKQKLQDNTHPLSPPPTPYYKSTGPHLSHLFEKSLKKAIFPEIWKKANTVVPIH